MSFPSFLLALVGLSLSVSLASAADEAKQLRIGYQRYGTLNILKIHGNLDKRLAAEGIKVQWILFPAGPQLLEGINVGSIDVGSTGEAPPVFAQAAGVPLVLFANEPANPSSEAILVPKDSPIKTVADLKGKKVALNKGSNVHYLLVKALEKAGVGYGDIKVEFLKPADARPAFEQGHVDAWVIWEPFLSAAVAATGARTLADGTGLVANREFYLGHRDFVSKNPRLIQLLTEELDVADKWTVDQPRAVAEALSPEVGVEASVLEAIARKQGHGVQRLTAETVAYQQSVADVFASLKLIPKAIVTAEVAVTR